MSGPRFTVQEIREFMYSSVWIQHLEEAFTATLILPIKVVVNDLCEDRQKKGPIISPN